MTSAALARNLHAEGHEALFGSGFVGAVLHGPADESRTVGGGEQRENILSIRLSAGNEQERKLVD